MGEDSSILGTRNVWWINVMFWSSQDTMELLQKAGATAWDLKAFRVGGKKEGSYKRHPFVCLRIHLTHAGKTTIFKRRYIMDSWFEFSIVIRNSFLVLQLFGWFFYFLWWQLTLKNHRLGNIFFPTNRSLTSGQVCLEQITEVILFSANSGQPCRLVTPKCGDWSPPALKNSGLGNHSHLPKIQYTMYTGARLFSKKLAKMKKCQGWFMICDVMPRCPYITQQGTWSPLWDVKQKIRVPGG